MRERVLRLCAAAMFMALAPWSAMLIWGGCASSQPAVKSAAITKPKAEVLGCAQGQVMAMGYTIEDGNSEMGFLRASKVTTGTGTVILSGKQYADTISVSVAEVNGKTTLQVNGLTRQANVLGGGLAQPQGAVTNTFTSEAVKEHVATILSVCGGVVVPADKPGLDKGNEGDDEDYYDY